ncbi:hypothetical protein BLNAU_9165 [Blattamonas nauphoetae]|uniref:Uncharacterized protein n=1 Tax=Blattamonas nauphoetae TaxID=2049346 RepID=A0ABQ9XWE1_9EUKA|nr:hypothetical protein BLNAU_9165 [Blattamonas nauphoetae]
MRDEGLSIKQCWEPDFNMMFKSSWTEESRVNHLWRRDTPNNDQFAILGSISFIPHLPNTIHLTQQLADCSRIQSSALFVLSSSPSNQIKIFEDQDTSSFPAGFTEDI